jgi:hypothetical protein
LDGPLKEFVGMVGRASKNMKANLESYNKDREKEERQVCAADGILSSLWSGREMDASDGRMKMLTENNEDLTKEIGSKTRSLNDRSDGADCGIKESEENGKMSTSSCSQPSVLRKLSRLTGERKVR